MNIYEMIGRGVVFCGLPITFVLILSAFVAARKKEAKKFHDSTPIKYNSRSNTCGMPTSYMLRYYNKYNGWSFNHIVYNVTWDGYNIGRTQGLYPHLYSIKQSTPKQTLSAYPNPVSTYLYFKKSGTYTLFDTYGKQVSSTNSSSMYVGKLSAGIYILRNGNNSMKIIKQ